jgi:hypothetical protein
MAEWLLPAGLNPGRDPRPTYGRSVRLALCLLDLFSFGVGQAKKRRPKGPSAVLTLLVIAFRGASRRPRVGER